MHANPEENVAMVDKLVLCQEDQPQIHHSVCPLTLSAVIWIIFHHDLGLKRPTEDQIEAIHSASLSRSKQLLNDVIFIWSTDKNIFTLPTLKNSRNNRLYAPATTKKKDVRAKRFLRTRMTFSQWQSACQNWTALV